MFRLFIFGGIRGLRKIAGYYYYVGFGDSLGTKFGKIREQPLDDLRGGHLLIIRPVNVRQMKDDWLAHLPQGIS